MNRVALVTGGTRGIGAAVSCALKQAGCKVAANYCGNDEKAAAFREETGIDVFKWDVSSYEACKQGAAQVESKLGPVDILVNNAGITRDAMFHKMTPDQWNAVIDTNLTGVFNMTHPVWPGMRDRRFGRVIIVSSVNGQKRPGRAGQLFSRQGRRSWLHPGNGPGRRSEGNHGQRHLPRLYRHGYGVRHTGKSAQRTDSAANSGWTSG